MSYPLKFAVRACLVFALLLAGSTALANNVRVATWNVFNHPNDGTDQANFRTIFDAINAESVNGVIDGLDILGVQETDDGSSNSTGRTLQDLNTRGDGVFNVYHTMGGAAATRPPSTTTPPSSASSPARPSAASPTSPLASSSAPTATPATTSGSIPLTSSPAPATPAPAPAR